MSETFLSAGEIVKLTGRKTKVRQIAILRLRGIRHTLDADGRPVVTRAAVEPRPVKDGFQLGEVA